MSPRTITGFILAASVLTGCGGTGGTTASTVPNATTGTTSSTATGTTAGTAGAGNTAAAELDVAFLSFGHNVTVALDGNQVVLEATGRPDHTSSYWNPNNSSGLYVAPDPAVTTVSQMSPGYIENYNNLFTLRIPASPSRAARSTATSLGPVGIAVSGAPIFNDQEGPNINLALGVIRGFDTNGAHTGPSTYHYHLEPKAITNNDYELVGVIADGFFLYGRKCWSTSDYPTDLDNSGGHTSFTQHTGALDGDEAYHYHIKNELYLSGYYLLFPEDYQGTPNTISH
jgi:hypothetical protein